MVNPVRDHSVITCQKIRYPFPMRSRVEMRFVSNGVNWEWGIVNGLRPMTSCGLCVKEVGI